MLIFQRPDFRSGKLKIEDLKLDAKGKPMRVLHDSVGMPIRVMHDDKGNPIKFKVGSDGKPLVDDRKKLIPDPNGQYILSGSGVTVPDAGGKLLKVFWVFTPDMNGQVVQFNDDDYVKKKYPNIFFKTKTEYQAFLAHSKSAAKKRIKSKADEKQKALEELGDDPDAKKQLEMFKAERKRFKR